MHISTANVPASQQEAARAHRPAPQPAGFEPLDFKQTQKPAVEPPSSAPTGYVRPGTRVDIKV